MKTKKENRTKKYKKWWKNHLINRPEKVWCPIHKTYEKTEFMQMGFGQKVLARRCVTYYYTQRTAHENFFDLIPIEKEHAL